MSEENEEKLSWDDIFYEHTMDNYPPFGGPFTNAISLEDYLKIHFEVPKRKQINETN